jgi:hypothetical protein
MKLFVDIVFLKVVCPGALGTFAAWCHLEMRIRQFLYPLNQNPMKVGGLESGCRRPKLGFKNPSEASELPFQGKPPANAGTENEWVAGPRIHQQVRDEEKVFRFTHGLL